MHNSQLQYREKLLATASNYQDIVEYFSELQNQVSDVRNDIGNFEHELEVRKGISSFLKENIDNIVRTRNNLYNKSSLVGDDT